METQISEIKLRQVSGYTKQWRLSWHVYGEAIVNGIKEQYFDSFDEAVAYIRKELI